MRRLAALILASCLVMPAAPAAKKTTSSSSKKTSSKKKSSKSTAKKAGPAKSSTKQKKTATKKSSTSSKRRRASTKRRPATTWRNRQLAPTPERYTDIQQALINKGYLNGPATGTWGADSVEALRRFQQDQNLDATGKLDSLTLISLGLGPRREAPGVPAPAIPSSKPTPQGQQP